MGAKLPRPKAIVCASAHWYLQDAAVTVSTAPKAIHDFGGFPQELYRVQYPAPGQPEPAHRMRRLLAPLSVRLDQRGGLDRGTWAVLRHVYPKADSDRATEHGRDSTTNPSTTGSANGSHLCGRRASLITGSGNVVHNTPRVCPGPPAGTARLASRNAAGCCSPGNTTPEWTVKHKLGSQARLPAPTPDGLSPATLCHRDAGAIRTPRVSRGRCRLRIHFHACRARVGCIRRSARA